MNLLVNSMSSYEIHVVEDETYSVLLDGIQLFMNKNEQYYSNRSDFERTIVSCSVVHVNGEYQATIIYKDEFNDN